jgi:hypothetical protein
MYVLRTGNDLVQTDRRNGALDLVWRLYHNMCMRQTMRVREIAARSRVTATNTHQSAVPNFRYGPKSTVKRFRRTG